MALDQERLWTRDFIIMLVSVLLFWTSFNILIPTLPLFMAQRLEVGTAQIGLTAGLMAFTALLTRPLSGFALDRWGRQRLCIAALFVLSAATFCHILVKGPTALLVLRALYGLPFGVVTAAQMAMVGDLAPSSRCGEAMGIAIVAQTSAAALGPILAMAILGQGQFERVFAVAGCLALFACPITMLASVPLLRDPTARLSLGAMLDRRVLPVGVTAAFQGLTYGSVFSFLSLYAQQLRVANLAYFYITYSSGQIISRAVAGRAFDRHGPRSVMPIGYLLVMAGYAILGLWRNTQGLLCAGLIYGLGWGLTYPSLQSMAIVQVPAPRRGAASATFFNGFDLGVSCGSFLMGLVAVAVGGYSGMYLVAAGMVTIPLALLYAWTLPSYRPVESTEEHAA